MSQQASDLPRSIQIIGRYRTLIGFLAVLGLLGGAAFAALNPPKSASEALVTFAAPSCPAGAVCGGPAFSPGYIQAGVLKAVPDGDTIVFVKGNIVAFSATAGTAAQAEAAANAAARSYIVYAGSLEYLGEHPSATLLQPASEAAGTTPPKQIFGEALLGAVFGALVGIIAALAAGQATIDPPTVPQGLAVSEQYARTGRRTPYATTAVSLRRMSREYAERTAARDGPAGQSAAEPP